MGPPKLNTMIATHPDLDIPNALSLLYLIHTFLKNMNEAATTLIEKFEVQVEIVVLDEYHWLRDQLITIAPSPYSVIVS